MRMRVVWSGVVLLVLLVVAAAAMIRPDYSVAELEAKYAGAPSRFVTVQGMRVHYRDEGQGPAVVLLHGMGSSLHTWDGWTAALRDSLRVIRLDVPGYGLTGPQPAGDYRLATYMPFVRQFLDSLHVDKASFAGNSLGGEIAWNFALAEPARVERLILVDAAGFPPGDPPFLFRLVRVPLLGGLLSYVGPRWFTGMNLQQVYAEPSRLTDATVDRYWELTLRRGNRRAFLQRSNLVGVDMTSHLGEIRAPTLVMWGEKDIWIPTALAPVFAKAIPGARLEVIPDAGHVPMEERPEATAAIARRFLLRKP